MPSTATLIMFGLAFLPLIIGTFFSVFFFKRSQKRRRSPLTGNLLRGPGETLRSQIEINSDRILDSFFLLLLVAVPAYALLMLFVYIGGNRIEYWQIFLTLFIYAGLTFWATRRLYLLMVNSRNLHLGLDGELAVGQELNHLMLHGCRVYHDFPAEGFNIDHVVVGPGGVYAVETKGRAKPDKGRGALDAKVIYDGEILRFPDWHEVKPLEQAKHQAIWLGKWLSSAVGHWISVTPALALPGWFVERTQAGKVLVFNGKGPFFLAKPNSRSSLNEQQIQQISHQLEQHCRDVAPSAYRKEKR